MVSNLVRKFPTGWTVGHPPELRLQLPASGAIFRMVEDLCALDFRRPAWENTWSFPWMAVFQDARGCIILTQLSQLWHMKIVHLHLISQYTVMSRGILWGKRESPSPSTLDIWQ